VSRGQRLTRERVPRARAALLPAALLAGLLPALATLPPAQAAIAVPHSRPPPAAIDAYAAYQGQSTRSPTPRIGALKLTGLLRATYGSYSVGISRPCSDGGQREHREGRALDWMVSARAPGQKARASAFRSSATSPDPTSPTGAPVRDVAARGPVDGVRRVSGARPRLTAR